MTRRCDVCGERVRGLSRKRRIGLWLRARLERLAYRVDAATAEPFDPSHFAHLHLTDAEAAAMFADLEARRP